MANEQTPQGTPSVFEFWDNMTAKAQQPAVKPAPEFKPKTSTPIKVTNTGAPTINDWNNNYNMKLSNKPGKYTWILFTNSIKDKSPKVKINGKILKAIKQIKLLGVILDLKLVIKPQLESLEKDIDNRIT